ncbi:MAG: GDSL-type esterase/lipase family protein [Steroidobacteraceae bacterium]
MENTRRLALMACLGIFLAVAGPPESVGANVPETTAGPRSLVILGASYAMGWGTPTLPGYDRVINRGVGGEETGDMLKRFAPDVVATKPDAVLIWGHVNNISRSSPDKLEATKSAARAHYAAMLQQARAAGIEVIFATEVPWTEPDGFLDIIRGWIGSLRGKQSYAARVSGHVHELNDYLRDLASREGCRLLDFERVFANENGTRRNEFAADDGSHISDAGYQALTAYASRELGRRSQP